MLTKPTKDEPASTERLREFILNDAARNDRLRTREAEQIVIEESRDSRRQVATVVEEKLAAAR